MGGEALCHGVGCPAGLSWGVPGFGQEAGSCTAGGKQGQNGEQGQNAREGGTGVICSSGWFHMCL